LVRRERCDQPHGPIAQAIARHPRTGRARVTAHDTRKGSLEGHGVVQSDVAQKEVVTTI